MWLILIQNGATSLIRAIYGRGSEGDRTAVEAAAHVLLLPTISADALEVKDNVYKMTALMYASQFGLVSTVKSLLEGGAKADATDDEKGRTSLMYAIQGIVEPYTGAEATAEALLDATVAAGAVNVQSTDYAKQSALMLASYKGMVGIVEKLLAAGAKAEMVDCDGATSLMMALEAGKRNSDIVAENEEGVPPRPAEWAAAKLLLAPTHAAGVIDAQSSGKKTALMLASDAGMVDVVEKLLSLGAKAEICDHEDRTCLMRVLKDGPRRWREPLAELLLGPTAAAGAINHSEDYWKGTALMYAIHKGMVGIVKKLLAAGARPEMTDGSDNTMLKLSIQYMTPESQEAIFDLLLEPTASAGALDVQGTAGRSALMIASCSGEAQAMEKLLNLGAKIDLVDAYGFTVLHMAKDKTVVEKLLLRGAKVDATNEMGKTSIMEAITDGREDAALALFQPTLAAGALDVKAKGGYSGYSRTALIYASEYGMASITEKLLAAGVDAKYDLRCDEGWGSTPWSALDAAKANSSDGHIACVAMLEKHLSSI